MREKKELNVYIGANIRSARDAAKYTQEKFSEAVGITPNHLSAIERGVSGVSLELLIKISTLLKVSTDRLLHGDVELDDNSAEIARRLSAVKPERREQVNKILSSLLEMLEE